MFFLILINHQSKNISFIACRSSGFCIENYFKSFQCYLAIFFCFNKFNIHDF